MGVEEIDQNISDTFRKFQNFRDQFPATSQSIDYVHVLQGLSWETHTIQFKTIQRKYWNYQMSNKQFAYYFWSFEFKRLYYANLHLLKTCFQWSYDFLINDKTLNSSSVKHIQFYLFEKFRIFLICLNLNLIYKLICWTKIREWRLFATKIINWLENISWNKTV